MTNTKKPEPKSTNERVAAMRQRRRDLGLVKVELWLSQPHKSAVLEFAKYLEAGAKLTEREK